MMIALPVLLALLSVGCISGHRREISEHSASMAKEDVHGTVEGIDDYHRADEYSDSWINPQHLEAAKEALLKNISDSEKNAQQFTQEQKRDMMQKIWLIANQELLEQASMGCTSFCAMCVPAPEVFEDGGDVALKTLFIERSKGWVDAAKMPVVAPIDSVAGAAAGVLGGLVVGGAAGGIVGTVAGVGVSATTNHSAPGIVLGTLAGISTGAITGAAVLVAAEIFLPLRGVVKGVGITGKVTECSRVGFEASANGEEKESKSYKNRVMNPEYGLKTLRKKMGYNKKWFTEAPTPQQSAIIAMDSESALKSLDYNAVSHCEYVRFGKFDTRHLLECIKHRLLCGRHGAILLPSNSKRKCQAMSNAAKLEEQAKKSGMADDLTDMWKDAKDRVKCVKMLCNYEGFKRAALKTHPDRVNNMKHLNEKERENLTNEFKFLNSCTTRFKTAEGEPLTLNSPEERNEMCHPQD